MTENELRSIRSLTDIQDRKEYLRKQIQHDEDRIAEEWNNLFHKEEDIPQTKAQRLARMMSLGTGVFDGVMLGWKLYRKYQNGNFPFGKRRRQK